MAPERGYPIGEIEDGIFTRHTTAAKKEGMDDTASSTEHPALMESGVERARETARNSIREAIENAPERTLLFIGGKSDQARTGQTGEVYGEELQSLTEKQDDLFVLTKNDIEGLRQQAQTGEGDQKVMKAIIATIEQHPDQKIVVTYPLWIKELSYAYENRWTDSEGIKTDYFEELVKKHGGSHAEAVHDWIANQGKLGLSDGRTLQGPLPGQVAKEYLHGLARLQRFAHEAIPNRPVMVLGVGHQWDLDAVATFLAKGKVDTQTFEEVSKGTVINEAEVVSNITITQDGKTSVNYRGKEFTLPDDTEA